MFDVALAWADDLFYGSGLAPAAVSRAREPWRAMRTEVLAGQYADPSLFRADGKWWMFVCSTPFEHDTLCLYYADTLLGPWRDCTGSAGVGQFPWRRRVGPDR